MKKKHLPQKTLASLTLIVLALICQPAAAQLNPLSSMYYLNQYLANPAMAGMEKSLNLNLSYRNQWNSIPGSPVSQAITAEYGFKKVGVGLSLSNDKAGLQTWTRIMGSYAYHLQLNEVQKLHFGVSLGVASEALDVSAIKGNSNDVLVGAYNDRQSYLDGDFGAAYTSQRLSLQGSVPNIKNLLGTDNSNTIDQSLFFTAISYKLNFGKGENAFGIEPKATLRGIRGLDNIVDAGANFTFINNRLNLLAVYHSTQSTTFGFGIQYQSMNFSGMYTNETSSIRGNANGIFEINLKANILRKDR